MRKNLLSLLAFCGVLSLTAAEYDYPYMVFETTDGSATLVDAESLTLTVSNGQLLATNGSGTKTFTLTQLSKMYFSKTATAISELHTANADTENEVEVLTPAGVSLGTFDDAVTAMRSMRRGIYVVKSKNTTYKVVVP